MSLSFERAIYQVRRLLLDRSKDVDVPEVMIEDQLRMAVSEIQDEGVMFRRETTAFATLSPGVVEYTVSLPSGIDGVLAIDDLIEASNRWPLKPESLAWFRAVNTGPGETIGQPLYYHLYVNDAGITRLKIHPKPDVAYTLDATWRPSVGPFSWVTNETLLVGDKASSAITLRAAANILAAIGDEKLSSLGLSRQSFSLYMNQSKIMVLHALREAEGDNLQNSIVRARG